jgi:murein DD-endopeptidase MepM/ murein hydrolase activator NlpD
VCAWIGGTALTAHDGSQAADRVATEFPSTDLLAVSAGPIVEIEVENEVEPVVLAAVEPALRGDSRVVVSTDAPASTRDEDPVDLATRPLASGEPMVGKLGSGQTLASSLASQGVAAKVVDRIAREMRGYFDFRLAHPGDSYRLVLDDDGSVESFRFRITDLIHYDLLRDSAGRYVVNRTEAKLEPHQAMIAGIVATSLYGSITALGASAQLADDFTDVFSYDVDFSRMARVGDEYRILYERLYRTDDAGAVIFVRSGRILAARYSGENGEHTAVYFEPAEGEGGYYRPDGSSVEREFLMAPLRYSRISSRYTNARRHPILKITRPHHGIDYAAPLGTPVFAVSGGEVVHKSWAGGFGNLVKIKHPNGYTSYYAHLSRFSGDLRMGQTVSQKQVVGYVGKTGLATGPHVCFRVAKNGKYVNPARISSPAAPPLPLESHDKFHLRSDKLLAALDSGSLVAAGDEAL